MSLLYSCSLTVLALPCWVNAHVQWEAGLPCHSWSLGIAPVGPLPGKTTAKEAMKRRSDIRILHRVSRWMQSRCESVFQFSQQHQRYRRLIWSDDSAWTKSRTYSSWWQNLEETEWFHLIMWMSHMFFNLLILILRGNCMFDSTTATWKP